MNRTAGGASGSASSGNNKRCMATGDDCAESGANGCHGYAVRRWNAVHLYETGGMRRTHLRGHKNILKRLLIRVGAFNLSLVLRKKLGAGTPRGLATAKKAFDSLCKAVGRSFSARRTFLLRLWTRLARGPFRFGSPPPSAGWLVPPENGHFYHGLLWVEKKMLLVGKYWSRRAGRTLTESSARAGGFVAGLRQLMDVWSLGPHVRFANTRR